MLVLYTGVYYKSSKISDATFFYDQCKGSSSVLGDLEYLDIQEDIIP